MGKYPQYTRCCNSCFLEVVDTKRFPREQRQTPPQLKGYRAAKRHTKTSVKRQHYWTDEEHRVFLKYCEDLRLACFHAIHRDVGGRPSELLALKLGDIKVETAASTGKKVCQFWIGEKGKTENSYRPASISDAIPYFNEWAHVHPARDWDNQTIKNAYLFPSRENKAKFRNVPLKPEFLRQCYVRTIEKQFPKLLDRPDILLEDKAALRSLIYDKPHFPYLRRHEFASDIAPRTSRLVFNQLMGHSSRSNLQDVYVQALGNEGVRELEIAKGIRTREETMSPAQIELQPKYCWACGESNKHNAKFCFKCNVAISREGMLQDKEREAQAAKEAERAKKEFQELKMQQEHNSKQLQMVIENLSKLISKSDSLDFKDIKWPLLDVVDYYEDNRGPGMGVLAAKDILKRWREKDRGNTTKNTL
jgi:integrase